MQSENICSDGSEALPGPLTRWAGAKISVLGRDGHICVDRVAFYFPRLLLSGLELSSKELHSTGWRGVGESSLYHRTRKASVVPQCPKSFYFSVMSDNKTGPKTQP